MTTKPDFIRKRILILAIDVLKGGRDLDATVLEEAWKSLQNIANEVARLSPQDATSIDFDAIMEAIDAPPPPRGDGGVKAGNYAPRPEPVRPNGGGAAALAELI